MIKNGERHDWHDRPKCLLVVAPEFLTASCQVTSGLDHFVICDCGQGNWWRTGGIQRSKVSESDALLQQVPTTTKFCRLETCVIYEKSSTIEYWAQGLSGHTWELNIELPWAHWTPLGVEYWTPLRSLDILCSWIFNHHELIGHPPKLNIEPPWAYWTSSTIEYWAQGLSGHTWELNIELPWAHWTPLWVKYWTPLSSLDILCGWILNSHELMGHPQYFNIELWWAHRTPSGI